MSIERLRVTVTLDPQPVVLPTPTQVYAFVGQTTAANAPSAGEWRWEDTSSVAYGTAASDNDISTCLQLLKDQGVLNCYVYRFDSTFTENTGWLSLPNEWGALSFFKPTILFTPADTWEVSSLVITDTASTVARDMQIAAESIGCGFMYNAPNGTVAEAVAWQVNNAFTRGLAIYGQVVSPVSGVAFDFNLAPLVAASLSEIRYFQRIANRPISLGAGTTLTSPIILGSADASPSSLLSNSHIAALVNLGDGWRLYGDRTGFAAGDDTDPRRFWHLARAMDYLTQFANNKYTLQVQEAGGRQFITSFEAQIDDEIRRHTKAPLQNILDSGEIEVDLDNSTDTHLEFDMLLNFNVPPVDWLIRTRIQQ